MKFRHGTRYGYRKKGCRCEACTEWNTNDNRRYWERRVARTGQPRPIGWSRFNTAHPLEEWR